MTDIKNVNKNNIESAKKWLGSLTVIITTTKDTELLEYGCNRVRVLRYLIDSVILSDAVIQENNSLTEGHVSEVQESDNTGYIIEVLEQYEESKAELLRKSIGVEVDYEN